MMKKNKLYTVNRWNQPAFMPKDKNIFWPGGNLIGSLSANNPSDFWGINSAVNSPLPTALSPQANQALGANLAKSAGSSSGGGFFSKGSAGWAEVGKTATGVGLELTDTIGKSEDFKRGMWDRADPLHYLAGGNESAVGNAMGDAGVGLFKSGAQSGNGYMMLAGAGLKAVGSLTNALFGESVDEAKLQRVNEDIAKLNSFTSNASTFDDIQGPEAVSMDTDVYSGGLFNDVSDKNEALKKQLIAAKSFANRSVDNNVNNLVSDQLNNALANYTAFGGPIDIDPSTPIGYSIYTDRAIKDK